MVFRIFIEKKAEYAVEAVGVLSDLQKTLGIKTLESVRILNRYDVEGLSKEEFDNARDIIFSEPPVDVFYYDFPINDAKFFAVEYLAGQFDQRADSCEQCISLLTEKPRPTVRTAKVYALYGNISNEEFAKIQNYLINPVEASLSSMEKPKTLKRDYQIPSTVETLNEFNNFNENELVKFIAKYSLAMDIDDIKFLQNYFVVTENRAPTITEIRMIDTYWSDHCRHTTFSTNIENVEIKDAYIKDVYDEYCLDREKIGIKKPKTLMDVATIGAKILKAEGKLKNLDSSEEINACSVKVDANIDGKQIPYLLMFKNETHNHPTEIEPFGGAATCLGGAIRDPLSGRSYVYQAMRVTGASDPRLSFEKTLKGKLPQHKIVTTAAAGYSSYGNQIGLATGFVDEIYHPGYVAKRLEIGAVVGAAPEENVVRVPPVAGDVVILLGGATGRDGCGGATGSSKSHTLESIAQCGAEVQKGNPPEERKIQRLFRNKDVTTLIKRCNDFGAGGISVAVGELADGLEINLDTVPKKYEGLDGTELAISESQERMAVVVDKNNVDAFIAYAKKENLNATPVANVTENNRLKMLWNGNTIVDISREFLNSNGAKKTTDVCIEKMSFENKNSKYEFIKEYENMVTDLNVCSKQGLVERFDSTIGAGSVLLPFGGKKQLTPSQVMAAKLPTLEGNCKTASVMAYGYNPYLSALSPFHGAMYAIIESVAKLVASGCDRKKTYLSLQEYFERTKSDPSRWGKPFAALLGALKAQKELEIAAIGGKDSMSGTFEDIDVPPTLVSFAIATNSTDKVISNEFKNIGSKVYLALPKYDKNGLPDFASLRMLFDDIHCLFEQKRILSCSALGYCGAGEAVFKMCLGNGFGFKYEDVEIEKIFNEYYGGFVIETNSNLDYQFLGTVAAKDITYKNDIINFENLKHKWMSVLEDIYPMNSSEDKTVKEYNFETRNVKTPLIKIAKPSVVIPVFPGTNCEYDTARAFEKYGANADVFVIRNNTAQEVTESVTELVKLIDKAQILMFPGGFSGGDEPDGSGKFIASFFRNPRLSLAVTNLLKNRDGLALGICNGFQALIKLGLVPYGEIRNITQSSPTLTFNSIGRHQSKMVRTRVSSIKSPWMLLNNLGDIHTVAISHGEGRLVSSAQMLDTLSKNGQIVTQYVDLNGNVTNDILYNPNNSIDAIEGLCSPDGRVFGKMAHSERAGADVAKNVYDNVLNPGEGKDERIFESGIKYFG